MVLARDLHRFDGVPAMPGAEDKAVDLAFYGLPLGRHRAPFALTRPVDLQRLLVVVVPVRPVAVPL